jgi:hypothetical protein
MQILDTINFTQVIIYMDIVFITVFANKPISMRFCVLLTPIILHLTIEIHNYYILLENRLLLLLFHLTFQFKSVVYFFNFPLFLVFQNFQQTYSWAFKLLRLSTSFFNCTFYIAIRESNILWYLLRYPHYCFSAKTIVLFYSFNFFLLQCPGLLYNHTYIYHFWFTTFKSKFSL